MSETTQTIEFRDLRIDLDRSQVFPDDPGQGTPAIVSRRIGSTEYTATFWCALGEGELESKNGVPYALTEQEQDWLDASRVAVDEFLYS